MTLNDELRLNSFNQVLLPMLAKLPYERLTIFFIEHVQKILAVLEKKMQKVGEISQQLIQWYFPTYLVTLP